MKNPEDMTRDELIGAVRAYRKAIGFPPVPKSYGEFLKLSDKEKMRLVANKAKPGDGEVNR